MTSTTAKTTTTTRKSRATRKPATRVDAQESLANAQAPTVTEQEKKMREDALTIAGALLNATEYKKVSEEYKGTVSGALRTIASSGDWATVKPYYGNLVVMIADGVKTMAKDSKAASSALGGLRATVRALTMAKKNPLPEFPTFSAVEKGSVRHCLTGWKQAVEIKEPTLEDKLIRLIEQHGMKAVEATLAALSTTTK